MGAVCAGSYEAITNRTAMHQILPSTHPTEAWGGDARHLNACFTYPLPRFVYRCMTCLVAFVRLKCDK